MATQSESASRLSLPDILELKYGPNDRQGWGPRLRAAFGYVTPDDVYEATVFGLVEKTTSWLDVGCGRYVFPSNRAAARLLSQRCQILVGIDPSDNITENEIVHLREQTFVEDYHPNRQFDLITLRMVAEHIRNPESAVQALSRLTNRGGRIVIYTVSKWAPVSILAAVTPTYVHKVAKRVLWQSEDKDTFPVVYRMNTRRDLAHQFEANGFIEERFEHLDDCRLFLRWYALNYLELSMLRLLRGAGLSYPESCILAIYRKT